MGKKLDEADQLAIVSAAAPVVTDTGKFIASAEREDPVVRDQAMLCVTCILVGSAMWLHQEAICTPGMGVPAVFRPDTFAKAMEHADIARFPMIVDPCIDDPIIAVLFGLVGLFGLGDFPGEVSADDKVLYAHVARLVATLVPEGAFAGFSAVTGVTFEIDGDRDAYE